MGVGSHNSQGTGRRLQKVGGVSGLRRVQCIRDSVCLSFLSFFRTFSFDAERDLSFRLWSGAVSAAGAVPREVEGRMAVSAGSSGGRSAGGGGVTSSICS